jgi:transglutaminase-like putative cysteine protease
VGVALADCQSAKQQADSLRYKTATGARYDFFRNRMKWEITHRTQYTYASPVRGSANELHLQPITNEQQTVEAFDLKVWPETRIGAFHDFYSNDVHQFEIVEPHSELVIQSHSIVTTHAQPGLALDARPASRARLPDVVNVGRCYDFLQASRFVDTSPETWRLAVDAVHDEDDVWQCALRLMQFVKGHLTYQSNSTHVHTHMSEALAERRGVCQDFAHVLLGLCRTLQIPALYVSGYLATETASATHAWIEVYVPSVGWTGLDPTHNRPTDETYVKIAVGRDYADVPPVRGTYKGTTQRTLKVEVKVEKGS